MIRHTESREGVIGCMPEEIGGAEAICMLPHGYDGACRVVLDNNSEETIAVVPSQLDSFRIARYAIRPDGYASSVRIVPAAHTDVTHQSYSEWL